MNWASIFLTDTRTASASSCSRASLSCSVLLRPWRACSAAQPCAVARQAAQAAGLGLLFLFFFLTALHLPGPVLVATAPLVRSYGLSTGCIWLMPL